MTDKSNIKEAKKWIIYFLISILLALFLMKVVEYKYGFILWVFLIITLISGLIQRLANSESKTRFIQLVEHTASVCTITLILYYIFKYMINS